jgi:hypothetical protein
VLALDVESPSCVLTLDGGVGGIVRFRSSEWSRPRDAAFIVIASQLPNDDTPSWVSLRLLPCGDAERAREVPNIGVIDRVAVCRPGTWRNTPAAQEGPLDHLGDRGVIVDESRTIN